MKSLISVFLAIVCCLLAVTNGQTTEKDLCDLRCQERKEYKPICGFNGNVYQRFANSCYLSMANCKIPNTYTVVSLHLCDKPTTVPPTTRAPVVTSSSLPPSTSTSSPKPTPKPATPKPTPQPSPKPSPKPTIRPSIKPISTTPATSTKASVVIVKS